MSEETIQPLKLRHNWHPVAACNMVGVMFEGVRVNGPEWRQRLLEPDCLLGVKELPHIWATDKPADLFTYFHDQFKGDPCWTFTGIQSARVIPDLSRKLDRDIGVVNTNVWRFGWKRTSRTNHSSRIHFLMDVRGYLTREELECAPTLPLELIYERAKLVRDFCTEMGLGPRFNFAGLSASLLRHPRFYPEERKRVPMWLNEKARPHLPGNHYDLLTKAGTIVKTASYHDQKSAHHHAALNAPMPTSDSLRGSGFTKGEGRPWLRPGDRSWDRVLREYGLFMFRVSVPAYEEYELRFLPHGLREPGQFTVPVWSSELAWLQEMGIKFLWLEWALTGREADEGIRRYAAWALEQADLHPELKQMLLATYGMLGARPSAQSAIHNGNGQRANVYWDQFKFKATVTDWSDYRASPTTNVIQRGIIEAYTRMLTLRYASSLPNNVQLAIYGDAVIIDGKLVAPIPEPWREKGDLTNIQFRNSVQFTSDQMSRLPGIRH